MIYKGEEIHDYAPGQRVRSVDGTRGRVESVMTGMPPLVCVCWDDDVVNIWDADDPSISPVLYRVQPTRTDVVISEARAGEPGKSYEEALALARSLSGYGGKPINDLTKN